MAHRLAAALVRRAPSARIGAVAVGGCRARGAQVAVRAMSGEPYTDAKVPRHRSDAQERIAALPPVEVKGTVAMCDGGGGATGHPIEWIQLDKREGRQPETCKYCGVRYIMAEGHHGH